MGHRIISWFPRGGGGHSGVLAGGVGNTAPPQNSLDAEGTSHASSFNLQRFVREREGGEGGVPAVPTLKKKPALRRKGAKGKGKVGRVRIAADADGQSSALGGDGASAGGGSSALLAALVGSGSSSTAGGSRRSVDLSLFQDASSTEATAARAQLRAKSSSWARAK